MLPCHRVGAEEERKREEEESWEERELNIF